MQRCCWTPLEGGAITQFAQLSRLDVLRQMRTPPTRFSREPDQSCCLGGRSVRSPDRPTSMSDKLPAYWLAEA